MVIVAGMRSSCRMLSESSTVRPSNSTSAGCTGVVPTAITMCSAVTRRLPPSGPRSRVCSSMKRAVPVSRSTWFRDSWSRITSVSRSITRRVRQNRSSIVIWFLTR